MLEHGKPLRTITAISTKGFKYSCVLISNRLRKYPPKPSEAESLPIPLCGAENLNIKLINEHLRNNDLDIILDITDCVVLIEWLELTGEKIGNPRNIWSKLRNRRINRKHSRRS